MKIKYSFKNMEEGLAVYMTSLIEYLVFFHFHFHFYFSFYFLVFLNYFICS